MYFNSSRYCIKVLLGKDKNRSDGFCSGRISNEGLYSNGRRFFLYTLKEGTAGLGCLDERLTHSTGMLR